MWRIPGKIPGQFCKSWGKVNQFQMSQQAVLMCVGIGEPWLYDAEKNQCHSCLQHCTVSLADPATFG